MVNENIIAIFSDAENAVCVSRLCETAVDVGQKLARGSFGPHDFEDYHGVVRISNV
jgi:hypothetical protein